MPVHNGVPHLDASIASVLRQTYDEFELVVLENGSSDGSAERLAWWAARDSRVTIHRAEQRLGGGRRARARVGSARGRVGGWAGQGARAPSWISRGPSWSRGWMPTTWLIRGASSTRSQSCGRTPKRCS